MTDGLRAIPGLEFHSPADPKLRSGLVSFRAPGVTDTEQFALRLRAERHIVSRYVRHPGMNFDVNRFSTHIFNSTEDVDVAVEAVRDFSSS
jgi:selenocysteine lyase/cysteine desulfurase